MKTANKKRRQSKNKFGNETMYEKIKPFYKKQHMQQCDRYEEQHITK